MIFWGGIKSNAAFWGGINKAGFLSFVLSTACVVVVVVALHNISLVSVFGIGTQSYNSLSPFF